MPPGRALRSQVDAEKATYPISTSDFYLIRDNQQLEGLGKSLNANCDLLFVDSLEGILDRNGKTQTNKDVFPLIQRIFNKPILGANRYQVEQGALAAVVKTGQEQGERSAEMLLQAMRGKSVSSLPVTQNSRGQRVINVSALERMGIMPQPSVLRGAALVRQQP